MPTNRPNILFIVVDDCGYADLGCTGQTDYATPALDRLAAEGVRFTQAYANAPLCTNTRVALMSGYDEFFGVMGGFTGYYAHIGDAGEPDFYEGETPVEKHGYVTDLLSER